MNNTTDKTPTVATPTAGIKKQTFSEREFEILEETTPDAIITQFKTEILNLVKAFAMSGQSGGSAPITAKVIALAVESLCLLRPIAPVTGESGEWADMSDYGEPMWQNIRCGALFKDAEDAKASYLDAIVWQGPEEGDAFTGTVYRDRDTFQEIHSSQFVTFPFKPKTFFVDVVYYPITKTEAEEKDLLFIENLDGSCYLSVVKDPSQLTEVFEYYEPLPE